MGRACGENRNMVKEITQWVVEVAKMPVAIKITPNYAYAEDLALAA
jgi:dihydroorotate dehydrogenase